MFVHSQKKVKIIQFARTLLKFYILQILNERKYMYTIG